MNISEQPSNSEQPNNSEASKKINPIILDGKEIYLVGTAHISAQSVEDVKNTIAEIHPQSVCIELCEQRYQTIMNKESWKNTDIFKILKEGKAVFFLAQLVMSSFYRRLGQQFGIQPGAEMIEAARCAKEIGANIILADRNVEITLRRVWGYLGFWSKIKLLSQLMLGVFVGDEKLEPEMIEKLKQQDQLQVAMQALADGFPEIKKRLIDERDIFLAQKIRNATGPKIVAVVGAGHISGIKEHIQKEHDLSPLTELPPPSKWKTIIPWSIPLLLLLFLILGFKQGGLENSLTSVGIWIVITGGLSALGTLLALGHPLSILVAFLAAPITTLHPMLAAGWFAGIVEAWVHRPTVADFENLSDAINSWKGFWRNPVTKILLVVALSNLGSALGMFISSAWIATRSI